MYNTSICLNFLVAKESDLVTVLCRDITQTTKHPHTKCMSCITACAVL